MGGNDEGKDEHEQAERCDVESRPSARLVPVEIVILA